VISAVLALILRGVTSQSASQLRPFLFRERHFFDNLKDLRVTSIVIHSHPESSLTVQLGSSRGSAVGKVL